MFSNTFIQKISTYPWAQFCAPQREFYTAFCFSNCGNPAKPRSRINPDKGDDTRVSVGWKPLTNNSMETKSIALRTYFTNELERTCIFFTKLWQTWHSKKVWETSKEPGKSSTYFSSGFQSFPDFRKFHSFYCNLNETNESFSFLNCKKFCLLQQHR